MTNKEDLINAKNQITEEYEWAKKRVLNVKNDKYTRALLTCIELISDKLKELENE